LIDELSESTKRSNLLTSEGGIASNQALISLDTLHHATHKKNVSEIKIVSGQVTRQVFRHARDFMEQYARVGNFATSNPHVLSGSDSQTMLKMMLKENQKNPQTPKTLGTQPTVEFLV
jgi:hypothetical protein